MIAYRAGHGVRSRLPRNLSVRLPCAKSRRSVGLKDLFSSAGRAKSRLGKLIKSVTNPYMQSAERYAAMQSLLKEGTEEAYVGMLKRFTIVASKGIEDEEEKGWAYRELSGIGEEVLPAVKKFCLNADSVAWALRIVEDVADESQEWDIIDALLEKHPPGYERDASKKQQILTHVAEIENDRVSGILASYLQDHDEGVRFFCAEQLIDIADESTREALLERLVDPQEESLRLRVRIMDGLADLRWDTGEHKAAIAKLIGQEHKLVGPKIIRT